MPTNLVQVVLPADSAIIADAIVNTFHFDTVAAQEEDDFDNIVSALESFYGELSLASTLAPEAVVKIYDLGEPTPRVPWATDALTLGSPSSTAPLPSEVALCLSYHALITSGGNPARKRGRVFLGPWAAQDCESASASLYGRPKATTQQQLVDAAGALLAASNLTTAWSWVVYSPTDELARPVVAGWVDNAWDTQRRRGIDPTLRTVFPAG